MFTSIQDKQLQHGWLVQKIDAKNGNWEWKSFFHFAQLFLFSFSQSNSNSNVIDHSDWSNKYIDHL
jgi:hypothetical protein